MKVVSSPAEMQALARLARREDRRTGLVPTMGSLHAGHLSLIRIARRRADTVVVSLFVNPTQFGPGEDFDRYPRGLGRDTELCQEAGADILFVPAVADMYPPDASTHVEETDLSRGLCGARRPGHFRGVATVVAKLFNIVQPDVAVFGRKDWQQARVIARMVRDLNFPVEIVLAPTVREADGLAMSSRNAYLAAAERERAAGIQAALKRAADLYAQGTRDAETIRTAVQQQLDRVVDATEYVEVVDALTLKAVDTIRDPTLVAVAVRIGPTRLIDNTVLGESDAEPA